MRPRASMFLWGLAMLAPSAAARADVPPPPDCRDVAVSVMPAPIETSRVAIRWVPASRNYGLIAARLVAEDGTAIGLDILADPKFGLLLVPQRTITPGAYRIEYSDTCSDAPASRDVVFMAAPPIEETPAPLDVANAPSNCGLPPRPPEGGPVLQSAALPLDDTLEPYLPFLRVILVSRTDSAGQVLLGEIVGPTARSVSFKFLHRCWLGPSTVVLPEVPHGPNELTMTGTLANGSIVFEKKATVDFNCSHCDPDAGKPDADIILDGGASDTSGGGAATPPSRATDAGEGCHCSTPARGGSTSMWAWIAALASILIARRRRGRARRCGSRSLRE